MTAEAELLARAKARLDTLRLYPEPVDASRVSIHVVPWLFRVPGFRRFRGYATFRRILLKGPAVDEDLVVHELCHIWQAQHRPVRMWLSYLRPSTFSADRRAYRANRYEREARAAVEATVSPAEAAGTRKAMPATQEVPGPVEPDQPIPNPPGSPETPDTPAPEVPEVDPKGPEIPDSPPSPEPQIPADPA